jgi:predicted ester cyclase
MTNDENQKAVMRRIAAEVLNAKNLGIASELCAAGVIDHSGFPGQPPGLAGMRARWGMVLEAFPDFHVTIHDIVAEGDLVALRTSARGTHRGTFFGVPPTGKEIVFHEINFNRIRDGKQVEHWATRSTFEVLQQLGVAPGPR